MSSLQSLPGSQCLWMISVLHIFATFYILFTLLADYVKSHPLIPGWFFEFWRNKGGQHGSQRRRSSRHRWPNSRSDHGGAHKPSVKSGGTTNICCTNGRRRTESIEATKARRWQWRFSSKAIRLTWCACRFWVGRVNNDQVSIALRPTTHAADVAQFMPKWMHTVQLDPNFVSEWQAQDNAFHLAQQFCILQPGHAWQHQTFDCQANSSHSSLTYDAHPKVIANYSGDNQIVSRKSNGRMVTFSDVLSIRIGNEEQTAMHDFQVHVEAMESSAKPWSLHGEGQSKDAVLGSSMANHHKRHKDLHTNKDAWVTPVDQSTHAMHRKQPFVQQTSDPCRDSMKAEESSSFDSARDHTLMSQCTLRTSNFEPWHARIRQFCLIPQCVRWVLCHGCVIQVNPVDIQPATMYSSHLPITNLRPAHFIQVMHP